MAVLTDKQMDKHIKERNFAKVYLIYGEEQMYVKKYTDKLVTAVAGKTPSEFNFHSFGDSINFDELAASVQIVPFMSEFNCVLVSDAAFDEFNANDNARFADIYRAVPDGCVFIVSLPSVKPVKNKTVMPIKTESFASSILLLKTSLLSLLQNGRMQTENSFHR